MDEQGRLKVGDQAPEFCLKGAAGEQVCLSRYRGIAEVVVYFYPKDNSPACTIEACSFRDDYERFREAGAEVIGISGDGPESHARFAARHALPFTLLTDPDGSTARRYGVARTLGLIPGRATFLIDRAGVVQHVFSSQLRPARHVTEMLAVLERLRSSRQPG